MISCNTLNLPGTVYEGHYCCAGGVSVRPLVVNVHSLIRATVCQWMLKFAVTDTSIMYCAAIISSVLGWNRSGLNVSGVVVGKI